MVFGGSWREGASSMVEGGVDVAMVVREKINSWAFFMIK